MDTICGIAINMIAITLGLALAIAIAVAVVTLLWTIF